MELGIDAVDFIREKYFDAKLREQLSAGDKKNIIIHIGRLDKEKKIELLVEIAKKFDHEKFNLVVVGGGGHEDDLKAIKSVYFAGYVPYSEVKRYLAVSDLGILVNNIEPYGLVGLEMMAMGLPILGPNAGGLTTFLRKEFAWLLPFDSDSYLKALDDWLEMADEEKSKKSQSAFLEARKYSLEKMVDKLLSIYNSV